MRVPFLASFFLFFLLIFSVHLLWEALNDTPPPWDMAYHQLRGWDYLKAWEQGRFLPEFARLSSYYPPLYYLQEALILRIRDTQFLALLANLPGLLLFSYCTFRIGAFCLPPGAALGAGLLPLLLPLVAWTSRESLLDVPLSGWVAAAAFVILKSEFLQRRRWTLVLAGILAAGLLTKWTFALFLAFPLLYALRHSDNRGRSLRTLVDALILALPLVFWWYLPNLRFLVERFTVTSEVGVIEGDPGLGSPLAWIYYPRSLSSYYLYLPLTLLLLAGFFAWKRKAGSPDSPRGELCAATLGFLWWWLLGGLLLLTLLRAKDPRYVMPLLAPLAIFLFYPWKGRPRCLLLIPALAAAQFLSVSFQVPLLAGRVALFDLQDDRSYRTLRQEWVLYQSHYFEVAGPPRRQNWRYRELLEAMPSGVSVGFVPDLAHFHPDALRLQAVRHGRDLTVVRLGQTEDSANQLGSLSYLVGKSGSQGVSYITLFNDRIYRKLEELRWPLVQAWDSPDQNRILLWRNPTPSR